MALFKYFPTLDYEVQENNIQKIVDIFRQVRPVSYLLDDVNAYEFYTVNDGDRPDIVSQELYDTVDYYWTFFLVNDQLREGLSFWPKSYTELEDFINRKYPGRVLAGFRQPSAPKDNVNVIVHQFNVGDEIFGRTSGATATVSKIYPSLNQMVLTNQTGFFAEDEIISNNTDGDLIKNIHVYWKQFLYADAPRYYLNEDNDVIDNVNMVESENKTAVSNKQYEQEINDELSQIRVIKKDFVEDFAIAYRELINQ